MVIGLALYPVLNVTLNLLVSQFGLNLPDLPDVPGGVLNYPNLLGLAVFAAVWWCLLRGDSSLSEVGFPTRWRWWQILLLGAVAAYVVFLLFVALPDSALDGGEASSGTLAERLGYIFFGGAVRAAVVEETLFRGIALTHLPGLLFGGRVWPVVLVSTIVFVFVHGDFSVAVILYRAGLALIFSALFLWRRSLRLPIVLHWLVNATSRAAVP